MRADGLGRDPEINNLNEFTLSGCHVNVDNSL